MKKLFISLGISFILFAPSVLFVHAQVTNTGVVTLTNPLNATYSSIPGIVGAFLNIVEYIGAICCALWIIWAGFSFVKARGNTDELTKAKSALLHAVIGTLIILAAGAIYTVIQSIINQIKA